MALQQLAGNSKNTESLDRNPSGFITPIPLNTVPFKNSQLTLSYELAGPLGDVQPPRQASRRTSLPGLTSNPINPTRIGSSHSVATPQILPKFSQVTDVKQKANSTAKPQNGENS
jgi:hypothetical protein